METRNEDAGGKSSTQNDDGKGDPVSLDSPDPPEDDLDDLDDILDDFASTKPESAPSTQNAGAQSGSTEADSEGFSPSTQELQDEMAALITGLTRSPDAKALFEEIAQDAETTKQDSSGSASQIGQGEDAFQDSIRRTMERMRVTGSQATSAGVGAESDGLLEQLLKEMQTGDMPKEGDEGLDQMLLGMMEQLTNKEILYDPMKELQEKFPAYLEKNRDVVEPGDMKRYELQHTLVCEIVDRFNHKNYSDSNPSDRDFIVDRMQKMQAAGSPPADLVGGMEATEALGDIDSTCAQQ